MTAVEMIATEIENLANKNQALEIFFLRSITNEIEIMNLIHFVGKK